MTRARDSRISGASPQQDRRNPFQLDRDRILYSMAFRRLAGVTQVVSPSEGEIFHNRLTHTIKVAQLSRRLAEMFLMQTEGRDFAQDWGGIEPEVTEAAALAHDLGHPPFGHIAEQELDQLVAAKSGGEGYEGNAQSFRILTTLSVRRPETKNGLDLTCATLNATLKYPSVWSSGVRKYGVYSTEKAEFEIVRVLNNPGGDTAPCIEAQIMDWADDIAYSVHDTEDFYRAGLIPLERLAVNEKERENFLQNAVKRRKTINKPLDTGGDFMDIFNSFFDSIRLSEPYQGTRRQREALYEFTSESIHRYVEDTKVLPVPGNRSIGLKIEREYRTQVDLLKELTWCYVIHNPALAALQHGQKRAIRELFQVFLEAAQTGNWPLFPPLFREEGIELDHRGELSEARAARLAADAIAGLTDQQASRLYKRITGVSQGSVLDPIVS